MSAANLQSRVEQALAAITNPRHGKSLIAAAMVRDLAVDEQGIVSFTFVLTREDPGSLARQARKAVEGVSGVTSVKMNVVDAAAMGGGRGGSVRPPGGPPTHSSRTSDA